MNKFALVIFCLLIISCSDSKMFYTQLDETHDKEQIIKDLKRSKIDFKLDDENKLIASEKYIDEVMIIVISNTKSTPVLSPGNTQN